jgi:quercetin dioxygenase-like cupin family protein
MIEALGEVYVPCPDLDEALAFFVGELGFRIEVIFPAEAPTTASLSGHGLRLRLAPEAGHPPRLRLPCVALPAELSRRRIGPGGVEIEWVLADPPMDLPPLEPALVINRAGDGLPPEAGRAGMIYRDLIPGRLGGRYVASLIAIPDGGPVADWVHFHNVRFQVIFCRRGWVRVAYEDQGDPIVMRAGDFVVQPPRIRHRVLEASAGLEVVEIGCPALHETIADHAMGLPTGLSLPDRDYGGQRFLHHVAAATPWTRENDTSFERQDSAMRVATDDLADVRVLRASSGGRLTRPAHDRELLFGFVLEGSAVLDCGGRHDLGPADAFVVPAGAPFAVQACDAGLTLLEVRVG